MSDDKYITAVRRMATLALRIRELEAYILEEDPSFNIRMATEAQLATLELLLDQAEKELALWAKDPFLTGVYLPNGDYKQ
jgi:hypothetical protein